MLYDGRLQLEDMIACYLVAGKSSNKRNEGIHQDEVFERMSVIFRPNALAEDDAHHGTEGVPSGHPPHTRA